MKTCSRFCRPSDRWRISQPAAASSASNSGSAAVDGKKTDNLNIRDLEREHILQTMAEVGGSRKLAIERLGISERTLRYKLQQYREEGFYRD